jgi:hypothetical protein
MVWARTKLMIHDDLLKPIPKIRIHYKGPNPEKFYKEIYKLVQVTFRVPDHSIQEKEFHWTEGDPRKFKVTWEVNKDLDKFSYYWIQITLSGESSKGYGKAEIVIEGALRTEYPQDTFWQRSLLYEVLRMFWHSTFYAPARDRYLREGRMMLASLIDHLKRMTRV